MLHELVLHLPLVYLPVHDRVSLCRYLEKLGLSHLVHLALGDQLQKEPHAVTRGS